MMSKELTWLLTTGLLLGLLAGAGIAYWLTSYLYQPRGTRISRARLRRLRRLGIVRDPGGVRWVSDWWTGTAKIGDPCLVVKDGQVLIVDTDDRIIAWLPSPYDKEGTVYMASGYRCLTANDGKPKHVYNTFGGGGGS